MLAKHIAYTSMRLIFITYNYRNLHNPNTSRKSSEDDSYCDMIQYLAYSFTRSVLHNQKRGYLLQVKIFKKMK